MFLNKQLLTFNLLLLKTRVLSSSQNLFSPVEQNFYYVNTWSDSVFMNYLIKTNGLASVIVNIVKGLQSLINRTLFNKLPDSLNQLADSLTYKMFILSSEKYYMRNVLFGNLLSVSTLKNFTAALNNTSSLNIGRLTVNELTNPVFTQLTVETLVEKGSTYPLFSPVSHYNLENKTIFTRYDHPFHLVDASPWPFCTAMGLWYITLTTVAFFHHFLASSFNIILGIMYLSMCLGFWWRDVIRESTYEFKHTPYVRRGLLNGMLLFIISEVMFFFGFFWAFFHSSLVPSQAIGGVWPPVMIDVISPWQLPLVNTLCLLLSGVTLTIAHRQLNGLPYYNQTVSAQWPSVRRLVLWMQVTVFLGSFFLCCQAVEYYLSPFTFQDTVFGGTFYILTGLHGMHVIVGTIFLIVCLWRASRLHFTMWKQVGFKAAVWYWHFVDVVWIFLFIVIYVWGGLSH